MESLEFTGERYIPGQGGARIAYEHLHRYFFALARARGKDVADLASGSGYGAALLASNARRVWGIEIDEASTRSTARSVSRPNLLFLRGDATRVPLASASIDLVVAFELIEHLPDRASQGALAMECARLLRRDGAVLISTPDRAAYSDARDYRNPFHHAELYRDEFVALLGEHFASVEIYTQQLRAGSLITPERGLASNGEYGVLVAAPPCSGRSAHPELYLVAVCRSSRAADAEPVGSAYLDPTDLLFEEAEREVERLGLWGRSLDGAVAERDRALSDAWRDHAAEIAGRDATIRDLQAAAEREIGLRDATAAELTAKLHGLETEFDARARWAAELDAKLVAKQSELDTRLAERDRRLAALESEFDERGRWAAELDACVAERDRQLAATVAEVDRALTDLRRVEAELGRIREALIYRVLRRLRVLP